jgi:hypothetical protein
MVDELMAQMNWLSKNKGASPEAIRSTEAVLHAKFSEAYRRLLSQTDGGNGRTSRGENICFFSTRELPEINAAANIEEFLPGWLIFASDLGGRSYLLRRNGDSEAIVGCFDEEFSEQALTEEAETLSRFLQKLI